MKTFSNLEVDIIMNEDICRCPICNSRNFHFVDFSHKKSVICEGCDTIYNPLANITKEISNRWNYEKAL